MMRWDEEGFAWHNLPAAHDIRGETIVVTTKNETDSWRGTFYGYLHDSAHTLHRQVEGDLTAEVTVKGGFEGHWDQAGLILRLSESHWIKVSMENIDGPLYLAIVVTNDASDVSIMKIPVDPKGVKLRATRINDSVRMDYFDLEVKSWRTARLSPFPRTQTMQVGITCGSPTRAGLEVSFSNFLVSPPID